MSTQIYDYILNTEILLLTEFKLDSVDMFNNLTLLDLHYYINRMEKNIEQKN